MNCINKTIILIQQNEIIYNIIIKLLELYETILIQSAIDKFVIFNLY